MSQLHDSSIPAHFTASAVIIYHGHILLIHHKRIGAWLPPGGHLEPCELPHQACLREVLEETGLECQIISDPVPATMDPDGYILPAPLCIHRVLAHEKGQPVVHIDIAYLCRPVRVSDGPPPQLSASEEVWGARWVEIEDLHNHTLAKNVPEIVQMALNRLGSDL